MSDFTFHYGPQVTSGIGASGDLAPLLPDGPVLFVTDANLRAIGLTDAALAGLAERDVVVFDDVQEDPHEASVLGALELARDAAARSVVGFGGGSPMDVAKAAAYLLGSGDDIADIYGVGMAKGQGAPLVLVPTTAGTGSEATNISILTMGETQKKGIVSNALYATHAVLDASLTTGLPQHVTAATGVDAMVHAIEAFTSKRLKNPISDALAKEALSLLARNLLRTCEQPDNLEAREAMLRGSYLAGVAFSNAPVGGVHALAYPLGGHFHVPHGLSNALMLPHVLQHAMPAAHAQYAELAKVVEPRFAMLSGKERARVFVSFMKELVEAVGLSPRLSDVGVGPQHLDLLADEAMKQERLLINNPVDITRDDARRLYEAAL